MGIFIMKNQKTKKERLEYFAGLAMQSFIVKTQNNYEYFEQKNIKPICFVAIRIAQEMIKQIDENEQI